MHRSSEHHHAAGRHLMQTRALVCAYPETQCFSWMSPSLSSIVPSARPKNRAFLSQRSVLQVLQRGHRTPRLILAAECCSAKQHGALAPRRSMPSGSTLVSAAVGGACAGTAVDSVAWHLQTGLFWIENRVVGRRAVHWYTW